MISVLLRSFRTSGVSSMPIQAREVGVRPRIRMHINTSTLSERARPKSCWGIDMTTELKFKWRVREVPSGPFRSFQERGWPSAEVDGKAAISLSSTASYEGVYYRGMRSPEPIRVHVADYRASRSFTWRTLRATAYTLKEAKALGEAFLRQYPEFLITVEDQ